MKRFVANVSLGKLLRCAAYLRPYRRLELLLFALIVSANVSQVVGAYFYMPLVDKVLVAGQFRLLLPTIAGTAGFTMLGMALHALRGYLSTYVAQQVLHDLRAEICARLLEVPTAFLQRFKTGEIISRIINDVESVRDVVANVLVESANNLLLIGVVGCLLVRVNWKLALLVFVVAPLAALCQRLFRKRIREAAHQERESVGVLSAFLGEWFSGVVTVKAYGLGRRMLRTLDAYTSRIMDAAVKGSKVDSMFQLLAGSAPLGLVVVVMATGSYLVSRGELSVGGLLLVTSLSHMVYNPMVALSSSRLAIERSLAGIDRILEFLDATPEVGDDPQAVDLTHVAGRIRFEHVSFQYPDGTWVLEDLSFSILAGERVALVGPTGAGKSTVVHLLLRLYEPTSGRILVDGMDIRCLTRKSLRGAIGFVSQEGFVFGVSVEDNIRLGCEEATEEDIRRAAEVAQIDSFIRSLPDGYGTLLGERGVRLSGGERQRLCVARAVVRMPKIIILDEATSALDSRTELNLCEALSEALPGSTMLVVAHRLSTISTADRIIVIAERTKVEEGAHESLLAQRGLYWRLFASQVR